MPDSTYSTLQSERIQTWLAQLTLTQKIRLLVGRGQFIPGVMETEEPEKVPGAAGSTNEIPDLGIPSLVLADGPAGVRIDPTRPDSEETFYCTAFPVATLLAATWDTALVAEVGRTYGAEAKEYGVDVVLGPGMNIHRNPLAGRNFEYYSEDPYLSGYIAAAMVRGVQSQGVGTAIKHFVANNSETNRSLLDTIVGERTLREIYLRGFEIAVKEAAPWTIMSAYNKVNGTYASESPEILETILRQEWGYEGLVMSDWFGGKDPVAKLTAGNDLLMPGVPEERDVIKSAVEEQHLPMAVLNRNVERFLGVVVQSPVYQQYAYNNQPDLLKHAKVARKAAGEGIVLLKNESNALPITNPKATIAAYGVGSYEFIAGGSGSGDVNSAYTVSLVEGLGAANLAIDTDLRNSYEAYIKRERAKLPEKQFFLELDQLVPEMPLTLENVAVKVAETDLALITLGRSSGETEDRRLEGDFNINPIERSLIETVSEVYRAAGKPVIVVLNIGNVVELASWREAVDAIVLAWQGGQEAGHALTDVLTGQLNPSGKLPTTFPLRYEDVPGADTFPGREIPNGATHQLGGVVLNKEAEITYTEGVFMGYRHYLTKQLPVAYPFGFGLSYTTFFYEELTLSKTEFTHELEVAVTVKNTGTVAGKEVVQVYLSAPAPSMQKPIRELKAFAKTKLLPPGAGERLYFRLQPKDLASFAVKQSAWIVEAGIYKVQIGASCTDIRLEATFSAPELLVEKCNQVLQPSKTQ